MAPRRETHRSRRRRLGDFDRPLGRRDDSLAATRQRRDQEQWAGDVPSVATHSDTCIYGHTRGRSGVGRSPRASTASTRGENGVTLLVEVVRTGRAGRRLYTNMSPFPDRSTTAGAVKYQYT